MKNNSPWLHQLNKDREINFLKSDVESDVAIVGGGIAGISTAFFLLRNTEENIVLVEGGRIAHGATGHNGGHLTANFEKPFTLMAKEFGLEAAAQAHSSIENAWELLDLMYNEAGLNIPLSRFNGYIGFESEAHVEEILEDNLLRKQAGLSLFEIAIAKHLPLVEKISEKFKDLYVLVEHQEILEKLESKETQFIAYLGSQAGVMNSALFTEEIAAYLLTKYPGRFQIFENTHINKVVLHDDYALLDADIHTVKSDRVILCTNGFENFEIFNKSGLEIDTRFHHLVEGYIGYMSAYFSPLDKPPAALVYFTDPDASIEDPYFYLTRRVYEYDKVPRNLISVGGPEIPLEDRKAYEKDHEYPDEARERINKFVEEVYDSSGEPIDYIFTWHGLMGYTTNRVRLIGAEPENPVLLYNLGCNGIGILPSIFGGEKISRMIKGEKFEPSIFDPQKKS